MNAQAKPFTDEELEAMPVEEQIIVRSKTTHGRLPMMEVLFEQFEASLVLALNEYMSTRTAVTLKSFEYMSCEDALKDFSAPILFGIASADPWDGQLGIVAEPSLIFMVLQTMLGGKPSVKAQKSRNFTCIEKRIGMKFYDTILYELARKFSYITPVEIHVSGQEEDPKEIELAGSESACVKVVMDVLLEKQGGQVTFIIPYTTFESVNGAFSQPFRGGDFSTENAWRGALTKSLQGTDIQLTAVMQELTFPLREVLAWQPGQILDIGIDAEHEVLVNCSGKKMFRAAMGCRKNGSVALRISETLSEIES